MLEQAKTWCQKTIDDWMRENVVVLGTEKEKKVNIKVVAMCWVKGKQKAHEVVELDEDGLLDVLRGARPPVFKTPLDKQYHWELREVHFT